jgi:hypothetical protein
MIMNAEKRRMKIPGLLKKIASMGILGTALLGTPAFSEEPFFYGG